MGNVKQKNFVRPGSEEKDMINSAPRYGLVSRCERLYVRALPDKDSDPVRIIKAGTKIELMEDSDKDFYKVKVLDESDGLIGYCMKQYIELS